MIDDISVVITGTILAPLTEIPDTALPVLLDDTPVIAVPFVTAKLPVESLVTFVTKLPDPLSTTSVIAVPSLTNVSVDPEILPFVTKSPEPLVITLFKALP